jgi:DNA-binding response OmpR family regulator/S1-C subfamily serine protease
MNNMEKMIVLEMDPRSRESLLAALTEAGYSASAFGTAHEALGALHELGADRVLVDAPALDASAREILATIRGSGATTGTRVILMVGSRAEERAAALDFGADDAISRPWDPGELLSRVRAQLRARRTENELRHEAAVAEEGQHIARTAFDALAVTEKMTSDASSLDKRLKFGLASLFVVAALMAGIYILFAHSAHTEDKQNIKIISGLERNIVRQQDLATEIRRLRATQTPPSSAPAEKDELQKHAEELKSKINNANSDEVAQLKNDLAETNARLKRVEQDGGAAEALIPEDVQSVCLLHVSVAFRNQKSGERLHYAGLNAQGEPIQDSSGQPVIMLGGNGPEVKMDVFGTGFLAGPGRVITNRHVAEPWWKNEELRSLGGQDLQAEISLIRAYFPGDPRAFHAEIQDISKDTDLATMAVDMQDLKRPLLSVDGSKGAAQPGEAIVSMGYATGLAALLARTDEETSQQILSRSGNDIAGVLDELARRNLIRPLITQGHIGDVLPDKIVFDAQTTSGGSGGPLINQQGKVVGVTFAVLNGFGGSNFGIPIRFSQPLLTTK